MFGQTTEVRLCEFWDEEMTYAKELTTRLPIEKIEETIEKVGLEYLRSHSELHNSEKGILGWDGSNSSEISPIVYGSNLAFRLRMVTAKGFLLCGSAICHVSSCQVNID